MMKKPIQPANEPQRQQALEQLKILDTAAESRFDRITRIAKAHFQVPITLVSLVDNQRQWFKSKQGLDACETSREISFCGHAILSDEIFYIANALEDPRFCDNPLVTGAPHLRCYVGAPLHAPTTERVGTLCLIDTKPRDFSAEDLSLLRDLADIVESELSRTSLLHTAKERAQLSIVAEYTNNAVMIINAQGEVEWVNKGFEHMTSYSAKEVMAQKMETLLRLFHTDADTITLLSDKIKIGQAVQTEMRNTDKNGKPYWADISIQPIYDPQKQLQHFIVITSDISQRKHQEYLRLQQEARTRAIVDSALDGIITIDTKGIIQTFNPAAEKIFNYQAKEVIGKNVHVLMPSPYHEEHDGYIKNYLHSNVARIIGSGREVTGKRSDGSTFPMDLSVSEMQVHGKHLFTGIIRDISECKAMEMTAKRLAAIIQSSDDAIMSKTLDGIITSWNPGAEKMFGYRADEAIGNSILMLFPEGQEDEEQVILKKLQRGENIEHFETTRIDKQGNQLEISVSISPIIDDKGNVIGASKIARDISERKRLERMKTEFISTVSHELRTPLTSIRGALGLVLGKFAQGLPKKVQSMLEMADRNSERLTLLINDILDLEKIESERLAFDFNELDLLELTKQALVDNQGYAAKHKVKLRLQTDIEQAYIHGDSHRLLQVFANLISNAVKYSPTGEDVLIHLSKQKTIYRIAVVDKGEGIPEAFRQHIFKRFAQADSSDTRKKGGTGLGLSISKAIIKHHHGKIDYDSKIGESTCFYFDLPAIQQAATDKGKNNSEQPLVLICEDNHDVATILANLLESEGITSDIANSAQMARDLLSQHNYRLLLLDLMLPDVNGLEFLQTLRTEVHTAKLPVIVVSGWAQEGKVNVDTNALAVVDWIQKPIDTKRLHSALQEALQQTHRPHILHIEDDSDIVQVLYSMLENLADIVHTPSLNGARTLLNREDFDLIILDLSLEDGSGLDLLDEIKGRCPVVIFSAQTPCPDVSAQVAAALTKSKTNNEQLLSCIKKALL